MLNQIVLVGRIVSIDPLQNKIIIKVSEADKSFLCVDILISDAILENLTITSEVDSLIGIKGKLVGSPIKVLAEKITLLSKEEKREKE